jgi:hypothetical protein
VKSKLNSGGVGVAQGVLMTAFIYLMRLLGQLNDGCGMMSRCLYLVALLKYKVSFDTPRVIVPVVVLLMPMLIRDVLVALLKYKVSFDTPQVNMLIAVLLLLMLLHNVLVPFVFAILVEEH